MVLNLTNITIQAKLNELANVTIPKCCSQYRQTPPVKHFHSMNRFGSSPNFSDLFSTDSQVQYSYVRGSVILPIILGIIFLVWTLITLIVLPCLGPKRVGFVSGAGFDTATNNRSPSNVTNNTESPCCKCMDVFKEKPRCVVYARLACSISIVIQFIFIFPLVFFGFSQVNNTTGTIISATQDTEELLYLYSSAFQSLYNITVSLLYTYQTIVTGIATECSIPIPQFGYSDLIHKAEDKIVTANEALQQVNATNRAVHAVAISIETYAVYLRVYWIPLLILTILMGALLIIVWRWENRPVIKNLRFVYIIIGSLFAVWTVLSWILLVCFMAGLAMNADACSGDGTSNIPINPVAPLGTMISVLYNTNPASVDTYILAELMLYYFGCLHAAPSFLLEFKDNHEAAIIAGMNLLNFVRSHANSTAATILTNGTALSVINSTLTGVDTVCNEGGVKNIGLLATAILSSLLSVSLYIATLSPLLTCNYISPIYNKMVNDAVCTLNPCAMAWILACLLIISMTGLTTITLRSSFVPVEVLKDDGVHSSTTPSVPVQVDIPLEEASEEEQGATNGTKVEAMVTSEPTSELTNANE